MLTSGNKQHGFDRRIGYPVHIVYGVLVISRTRVYITVIRSIDGSRKIDLVDSKPPFCLIS